MKNLLSMACFNITHRKMRSFLTLLGIVIGVAAVIATLSLGIGMEKNLVEQLTKFQGDVLTLIPRKLTFQPGPPQAAGKVIELTDNDLKEMSHINGIEKISGEISAESKIEFNDENGQLAVSGIDDVEAWKEITAVSLGLEKGRWLSSEDKNSVILGYQVAHEIFSEEIDLKKTILINGAEFHVVGVMNKAGGMMSSADQAIYMPIKPAREIFSGFDENEFSTISAKISKGMDVEKVGKDVEEKIRKLHKQTEGEETFTVFTPKFFQDQIKNILAGFTFFLTLLGVISLFIGGIGIMNIMYVSVMERTREIGIMKAVGADSKTVMILFLLEAGIFGLVGGLIGDMFGVLMTIGLSSVLGQFGGTGSMFAPYISLEILLLGLLFGFLVGIAAGYFPSRRAAKMNPVDALRYE